MERRRKREREKEKETEIAGESRNERGWKRVERVRKGEGGRQRERKRERNRERERQRKRERLEGVEKEERERAAGVEDKVAEKEETRRTGEASTVGGQIPHVRIPVGRADGAVGLRREPRDPPVYRNPRVSEWTLFACPPRCPARSRTRLFRRPMIDPSEEGHEGQGSLCETTPGREASPSAGAGGGRQ